VKTLIRVITSSCDRMMKRSATAGTTAAAAKGIALAPNELSTMAPPINPPSALASPETD
jgi:hypothetical protein